MNRVVVCALCLLALMGQVSASGNFTVTDGAKWLVQGSGGLLLGLVDSGDYLLIFGGIMLLSVVLGLILLFGFLVATWIARRVWG